MRKIISLAFYVSVSLILAISLFWILDTAYGMDDNITYDIKDCQIYGYDIVEDGTIVSNCNYGEIYFPVSENRKCNISVYFDERPNYDVPVRILYTVGEEDFSDEQSLHVIFKKNSKKLNVPIKIETTRLRMDIGEQSGENYKISKIVLSNNLMWYSSRFYIYWAFTVLIVIVTALNKKKQSYMFKKLPNLTRKFIQGIITGIADVTVCIGFCANFGVGYLAKNFENVSLGQLLYHLHTPLDGANMSAFNDVRSAIIFIVFITTLVFVLIFVATHKFKWNLPVITTGYILGAILIVHSVYRLDLHFSLREYVEYTAMKTDLYDNYYVDGRDVLLEFPDQKRNLIYIYLESVENTYADQSVGGAFESNLIPELTQLSLENINFGEDGILNGGIALEGTAFTMGALVAQTSGLSINETFISNSTLNSTFESDNNYFPGAWTLGDILKQQGYNQEFMCGSDGNFAGRSSYFRGHGDYIVMDYSEAVKQGWIPDDYWVWWGYEDAKLFSFAKEDILNLASQGAPFNFSMLTVDTHFFFGYECELCRYDYPDQYSNVIACSSRQVADFVDWISQQDFYDNTTIVLAGDHPTMDSAYAENMGAGNYQRNIYFTIINPAPEMNEKERPRVYSTFDLYPTTLAAMGVNIEGDRLGLGVNLFSDTPTLTEEFGMDYLNSELMKNSDFYTRKLLYGEDSEHTVKKRMEKEALEW